MLPEKLNTTEISYFVTSQHTSCLFLISAFSVVTGFSIKTPKKIPAIYPNQKGTSLTLRRRTHLGDKYLPQHCTKVAICVKWL